MLENPGNPPAADQSGLVVYACDGVTSSIRADSVTIDLGIPGKALVRDDEPEALGPHPVETVISGDALHGAHDDAGPSRGALVGLLYLDLLPGDFLQVASGLLHQLVSVGQEEHIPPLPVAREGASEPRLAHARGHHHEGGADEFERCLGLLLGLLLVPAEPVIPTLDPWSEAERGLVEEGHYLPPPNIASTSFRGT